MHKVKKYLLITALSIFIIGFSIASVGSAMGGLKKTQDYYQDLEIPYTRKTKTLQHIKEVRIDSTNQFVEVTENPDASVTDFILSYKETRHSKISFSEKSGSLQVMSTLKNGYNGASSLFDTHLAGKPVDVDKISLMVPQGSSLNYLAIQTDNAGITLGKIHIKEVHLSADSYGIDSYGNIEISGATIEKGQIKNNGILGIYVSQSHLKNTSISTTNGRININETSLENDYIHTDSGEIQGSLTNISGIVNVHTDSGQTSFKLAKKLKDVISLHFSSDSGKIYLDRQSSFTGNYYSVAEKENGQLYIQSDSGQINLAFQD